ncbi:MAG: tRNA epoxyqueuosine(34) reductase QueG [Chloroflexi bacterium]|nr:tRNA epoxyqueuosine(34) reductase QueG [Chloroflexota bacterium]
MKDEIRRIGRSIGFDLVRFASVEPFVGLEQMLSERIAAGYFSGLDWFNQERAHLASDVRRIVPQARTLIALGLAYPSQDSYIPSEPGTPRGRVARYAWGRDYHPVVRGMTRRFIAELRHRYGHREARRGWVDTARVVDRAIATRAGLGWIGKNTCLLTHSLGSWLLLAEVATDLEIDPDPPLRTTCGRCARCLPACPTHAFPAPGVLDARRCISFLTIESRAVIPRELRRSAGDWIFGCDVCQEVCPVNRGVASAHLPDFAATQGIGPSPELLPLLFLSEEEFRARYRGTPVMRTGRTGLLRNVCVALGNVGDPAAIDPLQRVVREERQPLVRAHAVWALGEFASKMVVRRDLEQVCREDPDATVRTEASMVLATLG